MLHHPLADVPASFARYWCAACLLVIVVARTASAQDAELSGVIKDSSGAIVRNASVTVTLTATGSRRTESTNAIGRFLFAFLTPGTYDVVVEREGFQTTTRGGLSLDADAKVELDVVMQIARLAEAIDVAAASAVQIDETPGAGLILDRSFIQNTPLNGRTLQSLVLMTPGAVAASGDGLLSINGMRTTSNYLTVDDVSGNVNVARTAGLQIPISFRIGPTGVTDTNAAGANPAFNGVGGSNDIIQLEAVEQVRVQTSASSAQYGRQPGAQIRLVSRSGSNKTTATAFEYFRDSALDAHDWFTNANPLAPRPALVHHQFGGVAGGPLVKNRMFYFVSYEGVRSQQPGAARQILVPALRLRNNIALSPALQRLIAAYPAPQGAELADSRGNQTGAAPFYDGSSTNQVSDAYSIKIDRNFGPRLQLSGRWNEGRSTRRSSVLSQETSSGSDLQTITVNARSIVSAHVLNELAVNGSRNLADNEITMSDRLGLVPLGARELLSSLAPSSASVSVSLPGNVQDYTFGPSLANRQRQVNVVDSLSWNRGRHAVRAGIDLRRLTPTYGPTEYRSTISFNSVASLLQNRADLVLIASSDQLTLEIINFSAYAQDTFRVADGLTIDAGLRWEVNPAPAGLDKPLFTLAGFPDLAALRLAEPGTPLYETRWKKLAPRVGVAYRLGVSERAPLLRASYGVFYDLGTGATATAARMFPYNRSVRRTNIAYPLDDEASQVAPPLSLNPPYSGQDFTIVDPRNTLPVTYQWSMSAQQMIGRQQTLTVTYTGNAGRDLLRRYFYAFDGLRPVNPAFPLARLNITGNDPGYGDSSDYHALQVQYMRRLSRRWQALVNYTLARATDTGSDDATVNLVDNATAPSASAGYSRFDRRHIFNATASYELPAPRRFRTLLSGWGTDYNIRLQSAPPLTVTFTYRDPVDGIDYPYRVDVVSGQSTWLDDPKAPGGRRLNPAAFAVPASAFGAEARNQVTHGNESRKGVRGFGTWQADFVLRRQFTISGTRSLQLRAEAYNVFNNPNFSQPDVSIGTVIGSTGQFVPSPFFGRSTQSGGGFGPGIGGPSTSAGGARSVQLGFRLAF